MLSALSAHWSVKSDSIPMLMTQCCLIIVFFPPSIFYISPPHQYPMVMWNAATEQRCTQMLFCCTGKLTQFPLYLLEGYEISFSPDVCFNGPGWPCSSEYGFCLWLLFERERDVSQSSLSLSPESPEREVRQQSQITVRQKMAVVSCSFRSADRRLRDGLLHDVVMMNERHIYYSTCHILYVLQ